MGQVKGRRQGLEVGVEITPDVVFDPLSRAQNREARAEPRQAVQESQADDHRRVKAKRVTASAEVVDRLLDLPRDSQRQARGECQAGEARARSGRRRGGGRLRLAGRETPAQYTEAGPAPPAATRRRCGTPAGCCGSLNHVPRDA